MMAAQLIRSYRRVIALAVLSALPLCGFGEFTEIPDLALRTCLTELASKNGWQQPTEFTDITCHGREIRSIEGISLFANLTKLSLYKNQIGNAKINGLEKLAHLNLAGNALTELHLVNLAALEECFAFNNQLATLTIENAPRLIKLKANNNKLKEFRLIHSEGLKQLYIFDNDLKELDMKAVPHLTYLDARQNPMSDEFYDYLDSITSLTALHEGNAEDWK